MDLMITVWLKQVFPRSQTRMVVKKSKSGSTPKKPKKSRSPAKRKKSETGKSPHKYWTYAEEASEEDIDDANEKEPLALGKGKRIRKPKIRDGDWFLNSIS